jgi:hypothetical protein
MGITSFPGYVVYDAYVLCSEYVRETLLLQLFHRFSLLTEVQELALRFRYLQNTVTYRIRCDTEMPLGKSCTCAGENTVSLEGC